MADNKTDVLIVEDDPDLSTLLATMLKFSGFEAVRCENPAQVQEKLAEWKPKVMLSDMLLSGYDGREICAAVRANPEFEGLRIAMMSAHPDAEQLCLDAGADEFISKPFDMDDLIVKMKKLMG